MNIGNNKSLLTQVTNYWIHMKLSIISKVLGHKEFNKEHVYCLTSLKDTKAEKLPHVLFISTGFLN